MQEISPAYLALLLLVSFLSSIVSALSGFGGGMLIMPFLLPAFGVKGFVPVITIAFLFGNFARAWVYRHELKPRLLINMCLPILPGVVLGTLIYDRLPSTGVAVLVGCLLIMSVPLRRSLKGRSLSLQPWAMALVGFAFGVLTGASPGAGVVLVSILLGLGLSAPAIIATDAAIGVIINLVKAGMFDRLELLDYRGLLVGAAIGLTMIPGAYIARSLARRISGPTHVRIIEVLVIGIGLYFLWKAATA
jgi:uncharacterized membrane protein YfcA